MTRKYRVFSQEVKLATVRRMLDGENVIGLARELRVKAKDLYRWRTKFRAGGAEALRGPGKPPGKAAAGPPEDKLAKARHRIAELERKVGQQQVELDFFRQALRQVRGKRRPSDGPGAGSSTRSSRR
jgi:transposase-like protein